MIDTKTKITTGAITILALATIVLTASLMNQENVYVCLDKEIAMVCDKLSAANVESLQTRCYFNDGVKDTYKVCSEGWVKFEKQEVKIKINNSYDIKDYVCNNETIIKECIAEDGSMILRVGI